MPLSHFLGRTSKKTTLYITNFDGCVCKMPCSIRRARCRMCFLINSQFRSFPRNLQPTNDSRQGTVWVPEGMPGAKSGLLVSICLAHNASTQIWPYSPLPDWSLLMWSSCSYYWTQNIIVINFINAMSDQDGLSKIIKFSNRRLVNKQVGVPLTYCLISE